MAIILNEPEKVEIINILKYEDALSPVILHYEIGNALSSLAKRNLLNLKDVQQSYQAFKRLPIKLESINIEASLKIAVSKKMYAYDAYYLELAQRFRIPILSLDKKLTGFAKELSLEVMEV